MAGIIPFGAVVPALDAASFRLKLPTRDRQIGQSGSELRDEEEGREMRLTGVECDVAMHERTATLLFAIALAGREGAVT
jgi:hypothetical protein